MTWRTHTPLALATIAVVSTIAICTWSINHHIKDDIEWRLTVIHSDLLRVDDKALLIDTKLETIEEHIEKLNDIERMRAAMSR